MLVKYGVESGRQLLVKGLPCIVGGVLAPRNLTRLSHSVSSVRPTSFGGQSIFGSKLARKRLALSSDVEVVGDNKETIDWKAKYLECAANAVNERQGFERRISIERDLARSNAARSLLPLHDELRRIKKGLTESQEEVVLFGGCLNLLLSQLSNLGVYEMEVVSCRQVLLNPHSSIQETGDRFDPKFHEAVKTNTNTAFQTQSTTVAVVDQVIDIGFMIKDQILRPARVTVITKKI